jgi:hypothetical protein
MDFVLHHISLVNCFGFAVLIFPSRALVPALRQSSSRLRAGVYDIFECALFRLRHYRKLLNLRGPK